MAVFSVPKRDDVSPENKSLFDDLGQKFGSVPNLYATLALSDTALDSYLALQGAKSTITGRAREVVNLVVSEINGSEYCLAAHTLLGGLVGFTPAQIQEIRAGRATFNAKLDTLAQLTSSIVQNRGHADKARVDAFLSKGWTVENLVDVIVTIGDKTITNFMHATTQIPVDFPRAPALRKPIIAE